VGATRSRGSPFDAQDGDVIGQTAAWLGERLGTVDERVDERGAGLTRVPAGQGEQTVLAQALRALARSPERFDTIVLDPPAFAKSRASVPAALRGYREINLRAMRCLAPGGVLLTASCSFHVRLPEFLAMLAEAAGDSGRRIRLRRILGQGEDHPEVLTIPETGYLKGAVLEAE